jgi:hypothetical protein
MIIGILGLIGSGKDTAADYLVNHHNFERESFAKSLKDAVSNVFGWDREMLEGKTDQSRFWREQEDQWWAKRLNKPGLTPRWVLQYWGTEVCRSGFHDDIWIAGLENRLRNVSSNIVISDCRFPNEISAIKNSGGITIRVKRSAEPEWYDIALTQCRASVEELDKLKNSGLVMEQIYPDVHSSEWAWIGSEFNYIIENNGSKQDLFSQLESIIKNPELDPLAAKVDVAYEAAVGNWHRLS